MWIQDLIQHFKHDASTFQLRKATLFYALWTIWKLRIERVFGDRNPNPMQAWWLTQLLATEMSQSKEVNNSERGTNCVIRAGSHWRPPPENSIKVNADAAFNQQSGKGSMGIIFRDSTSTCLTATSNLLVASSPIAAEALALREAISMASNLQITSIIGKSDNQMLIEICRGNAIKEEIKSIIHDIHVLKNQFQHCGFTWTHREGNEVAHFIGELSNCGDLRGNWLANPPDQLHRAINKTDGVFLKGDDECHPNSMISQAFSSASFLCSVLRSVGSQLTTIVGGCC